PTPPAQGGFGKETRALVSGVTGNQNGSLPRKGHAQVRHQVTNAPTPLRIPMEFEKSPDQGVSERSSPKIPPKLNSR
ncbi:MAG: hypothetical protein Q8J78_13940, partial [Moraxellaceae bacterium]|nr:hypothetical protein [Moraxellaceae bacterium]